MNKKLWIAGAVGLVWAFGVSSYINGQNKDQIDQSMAEYAEQRAKKAEETAARHAQVKAESDAQSHKSSIEVAAKMAVLARLKDPDSAVFRDQHGYCGMVNSKNSFGGYTGFKRYAYNGQYVAIEGDDMQPPEMDKVWRQICT